ncbi:MAG: 16S rRNA (adenine(1518)-N(6)/adenine(1519)-N(6))-dimethyltransferase RsmA [Lachnospiraceae bacterium]|nr:16S rRNA (adenine(1518)-N(6)/adenine(1519)-N(6))-dimethyltransferase RsmA [Lachnospiraceae bacterium]
MATERKSGRQASMSRRESKGAGGVRQQLAERGLSPNKRFGQNFLTDEGILSQIVDAADLSGSDTVLEIGPGAGALTRRLAERAGRVVAVEIDNGLTAMLREEFAGHPRVEIIGGDILKTDLRALFPEAAASGASPAGTAGVKAVANLPYYITTPILMQLLPMERLISRFVVMMQKEVADRMQAQPGSKDYGALTLAVQYYAKPDLVTLVPPSAFYPPPEVTSAVLCLDRYEKPPVQTGDPDRMFALVAAGFGKRRKTLVNAVTGAPQLGIDADRMREALAACGLDLQIRGEALTLAEYAKLSDALTGNI